MESYYGQGLLCVELEAQLRQEVTGMRPQPENMDYTISRRQAMGTLISFPLSLLATLNEHHRKIAPEEFLPQCAASITACWDALNSGELALIEPALSRYLPILEAWSHHQSRYQKVAAYFGAQGSLLMFLVLYHRCHFQQGLTYAYQAVDMAKVSGNPNLHVYALILLGGSLLVCRQPEESLKWRLLATKHSDGVTLPLQSKLSAELAYSYALNGMESEALESISKARHLFTDDFEEVPHFISSDRLLSRGECLEGEDGTWCHSLRVKAQDMLRQCRLWLAQAYEAQGKIWYAHTQYQTLLDNKPTDEEVLRCFMGMLHRNGKTDDALACYHQAEKHFQEYGLALKATTRKLAERLTSEEQPLERYIVAPSMTPEEQGFLLGNTQANTPSGVPMLPMNSTSSPNVINDPFTIALFALALTQQTQGWSLDELLSRVDQEMRGYNLASDETLVLSERDFPLADIIQSHRPLLQSTLSQACTIPRKSTSSNGVPPQKAWEVFAMGLRPDTSIPERVRTEFLNHLAETGLEMGDLDKSCRSLEEAVKAALALGSIKRYHEAYGIYSRMRTYWRQESAIRSLAALFQL